MIAGLARCRYAPLQRCQALSEGAGPGPDKSAVVAQQGPLLADDAAITVIQRHGHVGEGQGRRDIAERPPAAAHKRRR